MDKKRMVLSMEVNDRMTKSFKKIWKSFEKTTKRIITVNKKSGTSFKGTMSKMGNSSKSFINNFRKSLSRGEKSYKSFGSSIKSVSSKISKTFGTIKGKLAWLQKTMGKATAIGTGLVAGITGSISGDFEKQLTNLQIQTWLTWDWFKKLKEQVLNSFSKGYGEDLAETTEAYSSLKREMGLTGEELEKTAEWGLLISNVFGKDINETLRATTALMKNYGITWEKANEVLFGTLQKTGDQYNDVLDSINEYTLWLSQSGIWYEALISTMLRWTKLWLRNTDEMADVMREGWKRFRDESVSTKEAFKKLGLSYETDYLARIRKGEKNKVIMKSVWKKILEMQDVIKATWVAVDLFWTRIEDNGLKVLKPFVESKDVLEDLNWNLEKNKKILEWKIWNSWKMLKVTLYEIAEVFNPILKAVTNFMKKNEKLSKIILLVWVSALALLPIITMIVSTITWIMAIVTGIGWFLAGGIMTAPLLAIITTVGAIVLVIGGIIAAWKNWDLIVSSTKMTIKLLWTKLKSFGSWIWGFVKKVSKFLFDWMTPIWLLLQGFKKITWYLWKNGELKTSINVVNDWSIVGKNLVPSVNAGTTNQKMTHIENKNEIKIQIDGKNWDPIAIWKEVENVLNEQLQLNERGVI